MSLLPFTGRRWLKPIENINALTAQIGVLSESVTKLEIKVDRIADTAQQQNETAKIQAENVWQQADTVNWLTKLVEQLIIRN